MGLVWCALPVRAALQFDVFIGYDSTVHEAGWFPVACEVFNDGPSFNAVFELSNEAVGRGQVRRYSVELPTNTRKRFAIPVFASAGRYTRWSARLLDERGRVHAEQLNLLPKDKSWDTYLMGGLPRTFATLPAFPDVKRKQDEVQPKPVRLVLDQLPDNPICLDGLDAIYLNSEKAIDLKAPQVEALLLWLHGGGHLILTVEQPGDINGTPWLRNLAPVELDKVTTVQSLGEIQDWLKSGFTKQAAAAPTAPSGPRRTGGVDPQVAQRLRQRYGTSPIVDPAQQAAQAAEAVKDLFTGLTEDPAFAQASMPVATGTLRDGRVVLSAQATPLVIEARRGRGKITLLTFSPEREPFRSWRNTAWFWVKLTDMPAGRFAMPEPNRWGGQSIDAVFGAMIDSRQVRKLPVAWLLLLLVVYLVVIGPMDHFVLKKLGKQMWTWVTFPTYVVLFSALIYFIGYKLRAGESEWNELHLVDVLPRGEQAELRGRTYASIYSPVNARYALESDLLHATFRGEFQGPWAGGQENSRVTVEQRNKGFKAEVFVPVWTSQLYVSDWLETADMPLSAQVTAAGDKWQVTVRNALSQKISEARLVLGGRIYELGNLDPNQQKNFSLGRASEGLPLREAVNQNRGAFATAAQTRRHALGETTGGRLERSPYNVLIASLLAPVEEARPGTQYFLSPKGLDLSWLAERGDALVFAWVPDHSPVNLLHRFNPRRWQRDTMLRLAVPVTIR